MPSKAYDKLKNNLIDVERLIASHSTLNHGGGGRRGLGHITRSGVVMLCAAWELYIENLLIEAVKFLADEHVTPINLPLDVQKSLSRQVKNSKHDLKPLELSGNGWRNLLIAFAHQDVDSLNTPKSAKIDDLYKSNIGFDGFSSKWTCGTTVVDEFVGVRGDIAHRGRDADYVNIGTLQQYLSMIQDVSKESDDYVSEYLKGVTPKARKPWQKAR